MATMGNRVVNDHTLGGLPIHDTPNLIYHSIIFFANQRKTDRQSMVPISIGLTYQWRDNGSSWLIHLLHKTAMYYIVCMYTIPVTGVSDEIVGKGNLINKLPTF